MIQATPETIQKGSRVYRIGLAMERESIFARRILTGLAVAVADFMKEGIYFDLSFLYDRLLRDDEDVNAYDGFIAQIQDDAMAARLVSTHTPVIDVLYKKAYSGCTVANVDNVAIARLAAEHLIERNFEHLAYCGREGAAYSDERYKAFAAYLAEAGKSCLCYTLPQAKAHSFFLKRENRKGEDVENPPDEEYLFEWVKNLPRGTAVFCCQDVRAYQLCHVCYRAGLRIPQDIAVLGVDDDPVFCNFSNPHLSSIDPDAEAVGRVALGLLRKYFEEKGSSRGELPPTFVPPRTLTVRASTDLFHYDPAWLGDALSFISRNYAAPISVEDVFAYVKKSHTLVDRAFRERLGTSVLKEIVRVRLAQATRLLRTTELPIKEVARQSGFTSFSHFCSEFRKKTGQSANDYRQALRNEQ